MASHSRLKKELVAQYLDFGKEFFALVGEPEKANKARARELVAKAEAKVEDSSASSLKAAFNAELLAEAKIMINALGVALLHASGGDLHSRLVGASNGNERLDIEGHRQPKQHSVPSRNGFPKY